MSNNEKDQVENPRAHADIETARNLLTLRTQSSRWKGTPLSMRTRIQKSPKLRLHYIRREEKTQGMRMATGFELNRKFAVAGSSADRKFRT